VKFQCHRRSCELFGFLTALWLYVEHLMGSVVTGQHYARRIPIRLRVGLVSLLAIAHCPLMLRPSRLKKVGPTSFHMSAHSYQHAPRSVPEPCADASSPTQRYWICRYTLAYSILSFASCSRKSEQKLYGEDDHFCDLLAQHSMIATDCRIILSSSSRKERRSVGSENLGRDGWR
jgi:hypothetical protein